MLRIQSLIKVAWRQWKYIMHCRNRSEFYAHQFTFLFLVGWILWLVIIFFFFKKRLMSALPCSFWQGCIIFYLCTSHLKNIFVVIVVQSLSHVWLFATPCTTALQASLSFTISQNLLKFVFTESVMPFNQLVLCCPLLLLPSVFPSIRAFSSELALCIRWPKFNRMNVYCTHQRVGKKEKPWS